MTAWHDAGASGARETGPQAAQNVSTVDVFLEPELLANLTRSRRRVRELQANTQAVLKVDRARGMLRATGTESAIARVRHQVECLGGPRKQLTAAAWAELMRTRTLVGTDTASMSAVEWIQRLSSCRVHIERANQEVRLFGPKAATATAAQLVERFQKMCSEQAVWTSDLERLDSEILGQIAHAGSVSLRVEGQTVSVLGFDFAVAEAAKELRRYTASPESFQARNYNEATGTEVSRILSTLKTDEAPSQPAADPAAMPGAQTHAHIDTGQQLLCPTCNMAVKGNFCVHCGLPRSAARPSCVMPNSTGVPMAQMPHRGTEDAIPSQLKLETFPGIPFVPDTFTQPMVPMQFMPTGFVPVCVPAGMMPVCDPSTFEGLACAGTLQQAQQQPTLIPYIPAQDMKGQGGGKGKGSVHFAF